MIAFKIAAISLILLIVTLFGGALNRETNGMESENVSAFLGGIVLIETACIVGGLIVGIITL